MCEKTFEVVGLDTQRTAYEVEQFLSGLPNVERANADFLNDTIVIEYDETHVSKETILDGIEHAGCKPEDRINGMVDSLKAKFSY